MTNETPMNDKQVAHARKEFAFFDKDNNGQIDYKEFCNLVAVLSPKTDAKFLEYGFSLIDEDNDALISLEEFLSWWQEAEWET